MERGNVETVNPDSTLHARSRCAPSLSVMIPPLTLVQEPPWPNRFHSSFLLTRGRMRRDCVCDFNWPPPSLTYLSDSSVSFSTLYSSQTVFVAKLIKSRAHFLCALRCLLQTCNWFYQFKDASVRCASELTFSRKQWRNDIEDNINYMYIRYEYNKALLKLVHFNYKTPYFTNIYQEITYIIF